MIKTITTLIMAASCMLAHADDRFGFATHFDQQGASPNWNPDAVMPLIAATGAGWIRDDWNWKLNETSPGVYRVYPAKQHWLDMAAANGLKVVAVLQYPTSFYADPWDPQAAANFCAWTAQTEGSKIAAFEITNEPNNGYAATEGRDWKAKLVTLTNAVAKAVHAVSRQTLVIGYGAQGQQIFDILGIGASADGVVYHPYDPGKFIPESTYEPPYRDYETWVKALRTKTSLPLWETEFNISTGTGVGEHDGAVWLSRRLLMSLGLKVEHNFIYNFTDNSVQGVVRYNYTPKQALFVFQRILDALNGLKSIGPVVSVTQSDANFDAADFKNYVFQGPNDSSRTVAAVWFGNHDPRTPVASRKTTLSFPLKHPHTSASILNLITGAVTPVAASQWTSTGRSGVSVTDNPILIIVLELNSALV